MMSDSTTRPTISVAVNFFNMRREAHRTLFSLTTEYQHDVGVDDYEVIAIDNGSTEPLDGEYVVALGNNFRYIYYECNTPSPCEAINHAVSNTNAEYIMICVDGARILSPGILKHTISSLKLHEHPFVYTLGMHIGSRPQNYLVSQGYNQDVEDQILGNIDWHTDGYKLFEVSSVALSSGNGFFSQLIESNAFAMRRKDFLDLGGLDENFTSPGGGLVNLDFFNVVHEDSRFHPIMLLGEATFHQFHGGIATNVPMNEHPWDVMAQEYKRIRGKEYQKSYRQPHYYGCISRDYHSQLVGFDEESIP